MRTIKTNALATFAVALLLLSAACGGGSAKPVDNPDPLPQNTGLSGQLLQEDGARVSSAAGAGLQGALVSALKASNGELQATQTVGADGRFNFKSLPSGDFLVRIGFDGSADLDGDGSPDDIDVIMPATVQGNSSTMVIVFASVDSDGDGKPDSLQVRSDLTGSQGLRMQKLQRLNFERHELISDGDGDDDIDDADEEDAEVDADLDCIPDGPGHQNSLHGGVLHGEISAIDETGLTVDGVSFEITNSTVWRIRGNRSADPSEFSVGDTVLVRGLWNGESWLALEVKLAGAAGNGGGNGNGNGGGHNDDDDDSIASFGGAITAMGDGSVSVGDNEFAFDSETAWKVRGEATNDLSLFDIGDIVLVKASFDGEVWTAEVIRLILNVVKDDGGDEPIRASFEGAIEASAEGSLTVDGQEVKFGSETDWLADGALTTDLSLFDIGDEVKVDAVFENDVWTATKVTLLVNNVSDEPPGPLTETFSGAIAVISDTVITVDGQTIALALTTTWMADGMLTSDLSLFDVGDEVEVDGVSLDGTLWTALQVRLTNNNVPDDDPVQQTFTGTISAISSSNLALGDQMFSLNAETQWVLLGGLPGDISLFGLGDEVEVVAEQQGSVWVALNVTMLTDSILGGI